MTSVVLSQANSGVKTAGAQPQAGRFSALMSSFWLALEASGRRSAARHLLEQARSYESTQPSYARELRIAAEAALRP